MKRSLLLASLLALPALANVIIPGGPVASFNDPNRYWRGPGEFSQDGANTTIGNYIEKSGVFSGLTTGVNYFGPGAQLNWLAAGAGDNYMPSFYFSSLNPDGTAQNTSLLLEIAGWSSNNVLGWYEVTCSSGTCGIGTQSGVIFNGAAATGPNNAPLTVSFSPTTLFGFYFLANGAPVSNLADAYLTQFKLQNGYTGTAAGDGQQFVVFGNSQYYYIGVEDTQRFFNGGPGGGSGDNDYNDMVFRISAGRGGGFDDPVPEPGSLLLFGTGLVLLGWKKRTAFLKR